MDDTENDNGGFVDSLKEGAGNVLGGADGDIDHSGEGVAGRMSDYNEQDIAGNADAPGDMGDLSSGQGRSARDTDASIDANA